MHGAFVGCPTAGGVAPIGLSFDFDERQPVARQANGASAEWDEPYFGNGNVIVLKKGEIQPIQVTANSTHDYVAWDFVAELLVDGDREEITIDDEGRPFQITGAPVGLKFERYYEWPSLFPEKPQHLYISRTPLH
jgi:hypothetical protein